MVFHYTNSEMEFASLVCKLLHKKYIDCIQKYGTFNFGLTGGNTPKLIYKHLSLAYLDKFKWDKINFFFVDERCVPIDSDYNNYNLSNKMLFKYLPIVNVFRFETELSKKDAVLKYQNQISKINLNCAILGMGEDGHVGSIFPNSNEEYSRDSVLVTEKNYNGFKRFTLSIDQINNIDLKILIVNSNFKKESILKSKSINYPINRLKDLVIVINKKNIKKKTKKFDNF